MRPHRPYHPQLRSAMCISSPANTESNSTDSLWQLASSSGIYVGLELRLSNTEYSIPGLLLGPRRVTAALGRDSSGAYRSAIDARVRTIQSAGSSTTAEVAPQLWVGRFHLTKRNGLRFSRP